MALVDELVLYYQNQLRQRDRDKPKARADIAAVVRPIMVDGLLLSIQDAYDIDTAVGKQLDVVGKWVGVVRVVKVFTGTVTLNDDDFRQLIKMKIFRNNASSSLDEIDRLIQMFFPTALQAFDYSNMHMSYYFDAEAGSQQLAEAFVVEKLLPQPTGVQLGTLVYATNLGKIFGFRNTELARGYGSGFTNTGVPYPSGTTWLNTANGITL